MSNSFSKKQKAPEPAFSRKFGGYVAFHVRRGNVAAMAAGPCPITMGSNVGPPKITVNAIQALYGYVLNARFSEGFVDRRPGAPCYPASARASEPSLHRQSQQHRIDNTMIANILIGLVAAIHIYIVVLEMFLWTTPKGRRVFGLTAEFAQQTRVLAANQGLYNGFLAAGLIYGLAAVDGQAFKLFFLACVIVAGVFGAATASRRILFVQALPAAIALIALLAKV